MTSRMRNRTQTLQDLIAQLSLESTQDSLIEQVVLTPEQKVVKERKDRMCNERLQIVELDNFIVDRHCVKRVLNSFDSAEYRNNVRKEASSYIDVFKTMVWLEEDEQSKTLTKFNQGYIRLMACDGESKVFRIKNDANMEKIDDAINENLLDQFTLKPLNCLSDQLTAGNVSGRINGSNKDFIFVEILDESLSYVRKNIDYQIIFNVNRLPYQVQHLALRHFERHNLMDTLINNRMYDDKPENVRYLEEYAYYYDYVAGNPISESKLNAEQKEAVRNIVVAKNRPAPYILYGPPGTGKTQTLVAAIERIVRSTTKNVLVCANSNAACDEIADRLIDLLTGDEMLRFYAKNYNKRKLSARIEPISNWYKGEFHFPSLQFLYQFRVIICTLCTASLLTRAREAIAAGSQQFSYIIIDECASTHESMALVAIAGLCSDYGNINSSIVLAGDPKQLDAVTRSDEAARLGFKTSLMEHLFERPLYQRDPTTRKYNSKYITQLVVNYRSHSAILHTPNKLFYENMLQANASPEITDWFIDSAILPSKKFPIIFRAVKGQCRNSEKSFSLFNTQEVNIVIDFIRKLLFGSFIKGRSITSKDIGVVSPYKMQCKQISRAIRKNEFGDISVGTAEVFQGQERPIIIVSTVRSGNKGLGFVAEPRRLNVIITRAKCLLIIVGDPWTLSANPDWKQLIIHCNQNNALVDK